MTVISVLGRCTVDEDGDTAHPAELAVVAEHRVNPARGVTTHRVNVTSASSRVLICYDRLPMVICVTTESHIGHASGSGSSRRHDNSLVRRLEEHGEGSVAMDTASRRTAET